MPSQDRMPAVMQFPLDDGLQDFLRRLAAGLIALPDFHAFVAVLQHRYRNLARVPGAPENFLKVEELRAPFQARLDGAVIDDIARREFEEAQFGPLLQE